LLFALNVAADDREFIPLSDGKTFNGWQHDGNWVIEEGAFSRRSRGGSLTYTNALVPDDFELRFDRKVSRSLKEAAHQDGHPVSPSIPPLQLTEHLQKIANNDDR
jgi:hypothetical protein